MCNFKSAIVTRDGTIFEYPETDSHEVIIAAHGFKDDGSPIASRSWVRVEFTPPSDIKEITDKSKWTLKVDEASAPDWWQEKREDVRDDLWIRIKRMMVDDERKCLIGGAWILLAGARIHKMVGSRIIRVADGANLSRANLSRADLSRADLSRADLCGANLSRADLCGANLSRADLSRADLYGANLSRANLYGANLSRANLSEANLSRADLSRADLYGADLSGANLSEANRLSSDPVPGGWKLLKRILVKE